MGLRSWRTTGHLKLTDEELLAAFRREFTALAERADPEELSAAYGKMLDGCRRDPENRIWYAPWKMILKDSQEHVGEIGFKGPVKEHSVEVGYGVMPEHEGNGYASEAFKAMTQWAFGQKDVVFVEAEIAADNAASRQVLKKCGFAPDGTGEEGSRFVLESPLTNWSTIYMLFGIAIGMSIGQMHGQLLWGMAIGISLGVLVGMALNSTEKKKRDALRQQRKPQE